LTKAFLVLLPLGLASSVKSDQFLVAALRLKVWQLSRLCLDLVQKVVWNLVLSKPVDCLMVDRMPFQR